MGKLGTLPALVFVLAGGAQVGATGGPVRNVASFSPPTASPCTALATALRQAELRLSRNAVAVADAIERRNARKLSRACDEGRRSAADARAALDALAHRCPDRANAVRTRFSELPGEYAPSAILLARCN
jgi:hypothetical protein